MFEVGLVVRLHKLGLLPETNGKTFVKTITEYAVEGQDLTAMSSKSLRSVFTDEEFEEMRDAGTVHAEY